MKEIESAIEDLKSSPLFYLFVSSRELFHSNFWYWLSTLNKQATVNLFSDKTPNPKSLDFLREHNQRNKKIKSKIDLLITDYKDTYIVIENKVKDIPKIEQLDRINQSFANIDSQLILATLFHFDEIVFNGWKIITYKQIAEKIKAEDFTENNYYQNLIRDYKELTENLVHLTELLGVSKMYDFAISLNKDLYFRLNEIKLWEGYQKLRASHLINKYNERKKYQMFVGYGIHNQKATIDFVIGLQQNYKIGIQIEDNQFRKFIIGKNHIEFAESLRIDNIFFDSSWLSHAKRKC